MFAMTDAMCPRSEAEDHIDGAVDLGSCRSGRPVRFRHGELPAGIREERVMHTETLIEDRLRKAGSQLVGQARLWGVAVKILRKTPDKACAIREFIAVVADDTELINEALRAYLLRVQESMNGGAKDLPGGGHHAGAVRSQKSAATAGQTVTEGAGRDTCALNGRSTAAAPSVPNPPRGSSVIAAIQPIVAKSLFDKTRLADGTPWSAVKYRELFGLARDGGIAAAILKDIPQPRSDDAKISDLISEIRFAQIVALVGGVAHG